MSMGFLVPLDSPVAWRGLMIQKAMNQLLFEVVWPKLDLLVLDLPPGTGDVQLTITQSLHLAGESGVRVSIDIGPGFLTVKYRCCCCVNASGPRTPRCCKGDRLLQESRRACHGNGAEYEHVCLYQLWTSA